MDMLRIEKSYRMVGTELSIEYAAYESGLDRFVHPNKGEFIGRDALVEWQQRGFSNAFATVEVHDVTDADALGNNPVYLDGALVGRATSGNYGPRTGKSLAMVMVRPDLAKTGTELEMRILDRMHRITVLDESPFDPRIRTFAPDRSLLPRMTSARTAPSPHLPGAAGFSFAADLPSDGRHQVRNEQ